MDTMWTATKTAARHVLGDSGMYHVRNVRRLAKDPKYAVKQALRLTTLTDIGRFFGTDKGDAVHTFHVSYLDVYDHYFHSLRGRKLAILEIGVLGGASLRMWKAYFRRGRVCGLDIDPRAKYSEEPGISVEIGSQDDVGFLRDCFRDTPQFDIIIDDGSHINRHIIATFEYLFYHRLKSGGVYAIEDLRCSYCDLQGTLTIWPGMHYNDPNQSYANNRQEMEAFFQSKLRQLDHFEGVVQSIHHWPMLCIVTKVSASSSPAGGVQ